MLGNSPSYYWRKFQSPWGKLQNSSLGEEQHHSGWLFSYDLHGDTCQYALKGLDLSKVSLLYQNDRNSRYVGHDFLWWETRCFFKLCLKSNVVSHKGMKGGKRIQGFHRFLSAGRKVSVHSERVVASRCIIAG